MHEFLRNDESRFIVDAFARFSGDPEQWGMSVYGTGAVHRLEKKFSSLTHQEHALSFSNATLGLWAVFLALRLKRAEVITSPYSWGGSLAGILMSGNCPVFADVDESSLTLDPEHVVKKIGVRTRAILAVDIYGHPSDCPALRRIADDHGLFLVQDCAQSFGAYLGSCHTGNLADAAVFSLGWSKALFAGEGGVIVTSHKELYQRIVSLTQHPLRQIRDVPGKPPNEFAMNLRISPFTAIKADLDFESALARVETRRQRCLEILDFLIAEKLCRIGQLVRGVGRPSYHALTLVPAVKISKIEESLMNNGRGLRVCPPPVTNLLYNHDTYRKNWLTQRHRKLERCIIAENQCARRVQVVQTATSSESTTDIPPQ